MRLTIVIPAYNEEDAIESIIQRSLDARRHIIDHSPVDDVEIVVVSDGSTDRTVERAARFGEIRLIQFERNRGYGAAIKRGFEEGRGDLVAFLDADGTCDPRFFGDLCDAIVSQDADVAIGSRMGAGSRMPRLRRLGNRAYAFLLSLLSNSVVTDSASGMRVIRREALAQLYPLPDGLHFTPAMSARVLMDEHLRIVELPMSYEERIGDSKLHVVRDGVRFLRTILEMTLVWQPARTFMACAMLCGIVMVLLAMHPLESWLRQGGFAEGMIYRLLFCSLLGSVATVLVAAAAVCLRLQQAFGCRRRKDSFLAQVVDGLFSARGFGAAAIVAVVPLAWLVGPGLGTWLAAGTVSVHWSRVVLAGLVAFTLVQWGLTSLMLAVIRFHLGRRATAGRIVARANLGAQAETAEERPPSPAEAWPAAAS